MNVDEKYKTKNGTEITLVINDEGDSLVLALWVGNDLIVDVCPGRCATVTGEQLCTILDEYQGIGEFYSDRKTR